MKFYLCFLLMFVISHYAKAKTGIEKLTAHKIDSLKRLQIDTILCYQSSCGNCEVLTRHNSKLRFLTCTVKSGYRLTDCFLLYKQNGHYFILRFDCNNSIIKTILPGCKSIPYYISIIPILKKRDKTLKLMYDKGIPIGPLQTDGNFEDADIYVNKKVQHISMSGLQETDTLFKKYFWIDKQKMLLNLILTDIKDQRP